MIAVKRKDLEVIEERFQPDYCGRKYGQYNTL